MVCFYFVFPETAKYKTVEHSMKILPVFRVWKWNTGRESSWQVRFVQEVLFVTNKAVSLWEVWMWKNWNNAQMMMPLRWLVRADNDNNESDSYFKSPLYVDSKSIIYVVRDE